jgi:glutamate formiminotransferase
VSPGEPRAGTRLLAVPNVSEGRDPEVIEQVAAAFGPGLLDVHSDPDHNRSVFTLAGSPGEVAEAVLGGAAAAVRLIDLGRHDGLHPRVGAIDVAPIVYTDLAARGAACAEALVLGDRLGEELGLPVLLYGELSTSGLSRADLRRGGPAHLAERIASAELRPDFGPGGLHPSAGAVLVSARPPLVAFNVELARPAGLEDARRIAALVREGGPEGLPGLRAIGLWLPARERAQVSMNIEDHRQVQVAQVVEAIARYAEPARGELVGLAPRVAFDGLPDWLAVDNLRYLEDVLPEH